MQVAKIEFDQDKAAELYKTYRAHRGAHTKEDAVIERIYYQISRGKKVIRAAESIRAAGVDQLGRPKLAMIRADVKRCGFSAHSDEVRFSDQNNGRTATTIKLPWPGTDWRTRSAVAMVPLIPVHLRPQAADLPKYHILWEADWNAVPVDPMLLRRISGDAWIVVAAWDLTPVEQAVLAGRL